MRLGLLTGGGDCSGLNAAIRAVVRAAHRQGDEVIGIFSGWKGLLQGHFRKIDIRETSGLLPLGGTILGSSRVNPFQTPRGLEICSRNFRRQKLDALVVIGGEGTLKISAALSKKGMPIVLIPKTIDNDTWGTDFTIGFDTAVQVATDAIDRLHTTAESHSRVMIIEVMGRHAGWIATYAGIAGGADAILIPEQVFDFQKLLSIIQTRSRRRRRFSIFVVSEDAKIRLSNGQILRTPVQHDEYGDVKLGGIGEILAREIRKEINSEVRVTTLGHIQRGGTPTAFDRVLATRLGVAAVDLVHQKKFGRLVVLRGNKISSIPMKTAFSKLKTVDRETFKVGQVFFG